MWGLNRQVLSVDTVFAALASGARREILHVLAEAERNDHWTEETFGDRVVLLSCSRHRTAEVCACALSAYLRLSPATVSHHMERLTESNLATSRKEGQWAYYRLNRSGLAEAIAELGDLASRATAYACLPTGPRIP